MKAASNLQHPCPNAGGAATVLFAGLVNAILNAQCQLGDPAQYPKDVANALLLPEYDFVVIGGGSAGAAIASRLSEMKNWNVLLLEAGDDPGVASDIPALAVSLQRTSEDWQLRTEPDGKTCLAMEGGRCNWPRGKALGGSSSINAMLYVRGNKGDFDEWEKMGNAGWGYEEVLRYFKKSEDGEIEDEFHSTGGLLSVKKNPAEELDVVPLFFKAAQELGYEQVDLNSAAPVGYGRLPSTQKNSERMNTAKAFLSPARDRDNLHVSKKSHVTKLRLEEGKVVGVEFEKDGSSRFVAVKKEVILSAGTINSPQILMLSGIGPKDHLEEFGIPVHADLPVGENLQDHFLYAGTYLTLHAVNTKIADQQTKLMDDVYEYLFHRKGALASLGTVDFTGFVNTPMNEDKTRPDIQIHHMLVPEGSQILDAWFYAMDFKKDTCQHFKNINKQGTSLIPMLSLLRPKSVGEIRLRSANASDKPVIHPNYLTREEDVKVMIEGIKHFKRFAETKTMQALGTEFVDDYEPCSGKHANDSDEYYECCMRHTGATMYHPVGTCKMGPDPADSVVDPRLKVHGVKGLRVADASIMPKIVSANTNAASIMIGERVSDFIKEDWLEQ
ncbi:glucose dehydrogenase [FAD, quinone]-like [Neocloeon triangulifer]|uniref:glucose dehydrogenase [FAD, quinone]-like n=1 Tax=Neocloeon triangulifer TaxID=2078957 RepID=UPI00286F64FE|nr:glucose dehydrogenase [FAD, quinone]-like [Neocloeon triangulifer]